MGQSVNKELKNISDREAPLEATLPPPVAFDVNLDIPRDPTDERFVQSFSMDETEEYMKFLDEYGFVVIRNVLTEEEVENSVQDIWNAISGNDSSASRHQMDLFRKQIELKGREFKAPDRYDPTTWTPANGYPPGEQVGIMGAMVATQRWAFMNRQNENIYQVFKTILDTDELLVSHDRFGVMRPTKQVLLKDGQTRRDFPEYVSREKWMHWDMNPFKLLLSEEEKKEAMASPDNIITRDVHSFFISENNETLTNYRKLQGLVALSDSTENDGGFLCVPTFHKLVNDWANANYESMGSRFKSDYVTVPERDPLRDQGVKIAVRAGSLVVWDSRLPHCNYPNNSDQFRYVQYIKMFPQTKDTPIFNKCRKGLLKELLELQPEFQPSPLGLRLFGIEPWKEE